MDARMQSLSLLALAWNFAVLLTLVNLTKYFITYI